MMDGDAVTLAGGDLEATFLPGTGMLGASLRHRGQEVLALPGGLAGYRAGKVTGLPLLAPWANRLSAWRYVAAGVAVDLTGLQLPDDERGLPMHGTMTAHPDWEVVDAGPAHVRARFDFGSHPDLLASFPFSHELSVTAAIEGPSLVVTTAVRPTGDRPVPVSFGWHPYFRLPGPRHGCRLRLPACRHLELDDRGIPTGRSDSQEGGDVGVAGRSFDDLYELGDDRVLAVAGPDGVVSVELEAGYPYAQVFSPADAPFACLEPMTAPTDALVTGRHRVVEPGSTFEARFSVTPERNG